MIHSNFAWTFATNDRPTVRYVREQFIPKLYAELGELQELHNLCLTQHGESEFGSMISEKRDELDAAHERLASVSDS